MSVIEKDKTEINNQIFPFNTFQYTFSCQMACHDINLPIKYVLYYFKNKNTETPTRLILFYFSQYLNINLSFNGFLYRLLCYYRFLLIWWITSCKIDPEFFCIIWNTPKGIYIVHQINEYYIIMNNKVVTH